MFSFVGDKWSENLEKKKYPYFGFSLFLYNMYISNWDEFQKAVIDLYTASPEHVT